MDPRDMIFAIVMIFQVNGGKVIGTATGFFMENEKEELFLLTNKHVVEDDRGKPFERLILKIHKDGKDLKAIKDISISLISDKKKTYRKFEGDIDIVSIPLEKEGFKTLHIKSIKREHLPPPFFAINYGTKLSVVGFPRGFTDHSKFFPILKSTVVSTPLEEKFNDNPFFLMDGNLKKGMSGSPVLTEFTSVLPAKDGQLRQSGTSPKLYFIGIHSSSVLKPVGKSIEPIYAIKDGKIIIDKWEEVQIEENLELHTCYPSSIIYQLIK